MSQISKDEKQPITGKVHEAQFGWVLPDVALNDTTDPNPLSENSGVVFQTSEFFRL